MTVIQVADMHCEKCVARIRKIMNEEGLDVTVDLAEKTVFVNGSEQDVKTALEALEDLGFEGEVQA